MYVTEQCYEREVSCRRPQPVHCDMYISYNAFRNRHKYPLGTYFYRRSPEISNF